ncbi:hypothetical protein MJG53_011673 [Ovis ammon polii x Ovis aries]|uniref:Uncharacterized protein n=1 Tax=Ovis ammon polii x Ovis aries TaxID=2918886 RepID=A0ACB9UPF3_9CETA|nr:hypothetical protein MJG53_011673 [Ovis ammon polii x Ovis aries]
METPPGIESLGSQPPHPEFPTVLEIPWELTSGERENVAGNRSSSLIKPLSQSPNTAGGRDALTGSLTKGSVLSDCQVSVYSTEQGQRQAFLESRAGSHKLRKCGSLNITTESIKKKAQFYHMFSNVQDTQLFQDFRSELQSLEKQGGDSLDNEGWVYSTPRSCCLGLGDKASEDTTYADMSHSLDPDVQSSVLSSVISELQAGELRLHEVKAWPRPHSQWQQRDTQVFAAATPAARPPVAPHGHPTFPEVSDWVVNKHLLKHRLLRVLESTFMNVSAHPQAGGKWITQVKSMGHSPEAEYRVDLVSKGSIQRCHASVKVKHWCSQSQSYRWKTSPVTTYSISAPPPCGASARCQPPSHCSSPKTLLLLEIPTADKLDYSSAGDPGSPASDVSFVGSRPGLQSLRHSSAYFLSTCGAWLLPRDLNTEALSLPMTVSQRPWTPINLASESSQGTSIAMCQ